MYWTKISVYNSTSTIDDKVLDCGCGIGGPMRNIAKFTNATITGVTLNEVSLFMKMYLIVLLDTHDIVYISTDSTVHC